MHDKRMLFYAYKALKSTAVSPAGIEAIKATRRSWVTYDEFMPLLGCQLYITWLFSIYERTLLTVSSTKPLLGTGGVDSLEPLPEIRASPDNDVSFNANPTTMIDSKEFITIVRRAGLRMSDHEVSSMFDAVSMQYGHEGKVMLATMCYIIAMKTLFPKRENKVKPPQATQTQGRTIAAKMQRKRETRARRATVGGKGRRKDVQGRKGTRK